MENDKKDIEKIIELKFMKDDEGIKFELIDQIHDIPEADQTLCHVANSWILKTSLRQLTHNELDHRQAIRKKIIELIVKNPGAQNHFFKARQAQLLPTMSESARAHAAPIPFDNTFDGDEMNITNLPLNTVPDGVELQRNPTLERAKTGVKITRIDQNKAEELKESIVKKLTNIAIEKQKELMKNVPLLPDDIRTDALKILKKIFKSYEHELIEKIPMTEQSSLVDYTFLDPVITPILPTGVGYEWMHHSDVYDMRLCATIQAIYGIENFDPRVTFRKMVSKLKGIDTSKFDNSPICVSINRQKTKFMRTEPIIKMSDPLSKDDFNKVIEMFKKIYISGEIENLSDAYISCESELYEFIFLKTSDDHCDDPDETYEEFIVTNENRVLDKFKEVFGIELEDSHIKLVDLIKMI